MVAVDTTTITIAHTAALVVNPTALATDAAKLVAYPTALATDAAALGAEPCQHSLCCSTCWIYNSKKDNGGAMTQLVEITSKLFAPHNIRKQDAAALTALRILSLKH